MMASSLRKCAFALLCLLSQTGAIDPPRQAHQPTGNGTRLLTYNETTPNPTIFPTTIDVRWTANDTLWTTFDTKGDLILEDAASGDNSTFVSADKLPKSIRDYWVSPDLKTVMVAANATQNFQFSYFADYFLIDVQSGDSTPLVNAQTRDIQYASWAPDSSSIAFVRGNNLFLRFTNGTVNQITNDGSPHMFNAVADWVYEEEILTGQPALWFAPDSKYIAFLSFNDSAVGKMTIPFYMDGQSVAPAYPTETKLRYPKTGTANPSVHFNLLNIETLEVSEIAFDTFGNETIIGEVAWVTDDHTAVLYRAFNRFQDMEKYVLVNPDDQSAKIVRERDGTDGWLDNTKSITYAGEVEGSFFYADLSDESGWMHVYLYHVDSSKSIQLTSGDWEVSSIVHVDHARRLIYYEAAKAHSTERHVYSVSYLTTANDTLVDDTIPAVWSASFSSNGSYYSLTYFGPDVPYQEMYSADNTSVPLKTLASNTGFFDSIAELKLPNITYFELQHPDNFSLNVMQQLPANFDPSKQYPVLFTPYGGPGSQTVVKTFQEYGWASYISSEPELQFITYTVDNRGTGFKGRAFRSTVLKQLGTLEAEDQIWAAQQLIANKTFINKDHVGIWGWSFGGYLAAKTIEADSGVFTMGLSTAPVGDWRLYDSMYSERYMKDLESNSPAYDEAMVRNATGFGNLSGSFALMHGTGDENVHFQNCAYLLDRMVGGGVAPDKLRLMAFTDSGHSIGADGASAFLYQFLTQQLWEEVQRQTGPGMVHQWSMGSG